MKFVPLTISNLLYEFLHFHNREMYMDMKKEVHLVSPLEMIIHTS